jgi:hypothetical protein
MQCIDGNGVGQETECGIGRVLHCVVVKVWARGRRDEHGVEIGPSVLLPYPQRDQWTTYGSVVRAHQSGGTSTGRTVSQE